jgi:Fe-S cluster assembly protein SufD
MNINSTFNKNFIEIDLNKEGSEVKINILNLARNQQHLDNNILMNHNAEHCISFQNVRNILDDQATCVFNGKVVVADGAQKTDSNQSNKNLLLSRNATAHSNPQLEIYADDVKCGHGSTTGALDKDSIFYLRARGIKESDANNILVKAFAKEILQEFVSDDIRNLSENNLSHWIDG